MRGYAPQAGHFRRPAEGRATLAAGPHHPGRGARNRGAHATRFLQYRARRLACHHPCQLSRKGASPLCESCAAQPFSGDLCRHRSRDRRVRRFRRPCSPRAGASRHPRSASIERLQPSVGEIQLRDGLRRRYAVTSHSSQGLTAERVLVNADTGVHPDLLNSRFGYVSISRASHEATIFTDDLSKLSPQLSADVSKTSALEIGPTQSVAQGIAIGI